VDLSGREQLEQQLSAFLDGELTDEQVAELQRMLAASPDAKQLLAELEKTVAAVRGLPREPSPGDLYESITAQLERSALLEGDVAEGSPVGAAGRWGWLVRLTVSAAVVLLAVGVGYLAVVRGANGPPKVDKYRGEKQLAMVEREKSGRLAEEVAQRVERKIPEVKPAKGKASGEVPGATAPVSKRGRQGGLVDAELGGPSVGVATSGQAEGMRWLGSGRADVDRSGGRVTLVVTAAQARAVWGSWLKLAQFSSSEGISVLEGDVVDDSSVGGDHDVGSAGSVVYWFKASEVQVRRLVGRLGAVEGASVTVQRGGDRRVVGVSDSEERAEWRIGGRYILEGRSGLAEAGDRRAGGVPATQPTTDRSVGPQRRRVAVGRVGGQAGPLGMVEVRLVIRMSAAERSSVSNG